MKSVCGLLKCNKGFSLAEMLVVIAIMAILTGGAVASISIINNANVNKAAQTLDDAFSKARSNGMARGDSTYTFNLSMIGNDLYASYGGATEKISGGGVSVSLPATTSFWFGADGSVRGTAAVSENVIFTRGDRSAKFWFYRITGEHGVTLN
ncbi:MAG: type II secretion system GspH family protein [Lachnospiraceae bacterium]|nr:type II secretion system GspH family protein [Lachnospiraceae bacterium]